jgi:tetratricopeptide (TPR) repeat protein
MIQKHNEMLFPVIERQQGKVIKTIGDGIMSSFAEPIQAVRSAIEIQKMLSHYNRGKKELDQIQVRVGINTGLGLVETSDVFGEVVIVAQRLESIAQAGQILTSQSVYDKVKSSEDVVCRYLDTMTFKGKTEPMKIYRVIWGEGESGKEKCPGASLPSSSEQGVNLGRWERFKKGKNLLQRINILIFLVIMAGALSRIGFGIWKGSQDRAAEAAYAQLRLNKLTEAKKSFEKLKNNNPVKYEGLAAIAYNEGDYLNALPLCEKSLEIDPETVYSRVLKGNILLNQRKWKEATTEYEKAANAGHGTNWQKSEAFQSLGKMAAQEERLEDALSYYMKAAEYNPSSSEIYTGQGMMMERVGKLGEALSSYQKALKVNPEDPLVPVLFKETKRKVEVAKDKDKQERINALVDELLKASRGKGLRTKEKDTWTSRPLTLTFLSLERRGGLASLREGMDAYITLRLTSALQAEGRVKVVEREILDKLLEELKLSTTQLVDQESALKVGRILAARLIGTGSITQLGSKIILTLKFIETETTQVVAAFSESFDNSKDLDSIINKVSRETIANLKKEYPLRGKIISSEGDTVTMNLGSDEGVTKGLKMRIFTGITPMEKREIGLVEVTSVNPSNCKAKVVEKERGLFAGSKVEEFTD